ncbi:MAG: helix-turn-helix transcriptional regulator [Chloroflexi bacterium]|nr:helix-turn-helix transcriptional regulator [Chloroflexota bacterium]MCY4248180.1 helix-turn-helix transcriptional regulator [Chloroflexota bacterium]
MRRFESIFGKVVKKRRRRLGLSQESLGFLSGLHRTYISEIERGQKSPSLRAIVAIAQALDINASELILLAEKKQALIAVDTDEAGG